MDAVRHPRRLGRWRDRGPSVRRAGTSTAAWHGLVAWAATTLVIFYLLTTAVGSIVGGAFGVLGTAAGTAAGTVASVAPAVTEAVDPFSGIETNLNDAIGVSDPEAARTALTSLVRDAFSAEGDAAGPAMDRAGDCARPGDTDDAGSGARAAHDVEGRVSTRRLPLRRPRRLKRRMRRGRQPRPPASSASSRWSSVRSPAGSAV